MKATIEGTAAELSQFFRTRAQEDSEQVCMFCGCTDEDACPDGCSWVAPGVCSCCADIIHEALQQDESIVRKTAGNVSKRRKNTFKDTERTKNTPETTDIISIGSLLIPVFEHDRKLKSSYKTLFFTEMDTGTVLSYSGTKLYVNRDRMLELPNPVPHGYFGKLKSGTPANMATAIRFYRAYLAEQPEGKKGLKSDKPPGIEQKPVELEQKELKPKPTLLSGKNGIVTLAPFVEAERFDYTKLPNKILGSIMYYENSDGRIAIKYYGHGDIVFLIKEQVEILKKMNSEDFAEYISSINTQKQRILKKYIENLKDDAIGALGKVKTDTRVTKD